MQLKKNLKVIIMQQGKIMKKFKFIIVLRLFVLFLPNICFAGSQFHLDTLLQVGNKHGNGVFTVSNLSDDILYLKTEVVKIDVKNGKIKKIPLTRDNFPMWDLAVNPTKLMLNPSEIKDVAIKYLCQGDCFRKEDLVYQIRFTPAEVHDENGQSVNILFGMAPYYIVPATHPEVKYDFKYNEKNGVIHVANNGNSFIKIQLNNCNKVENKSKNKCQIVYNVLSGRVKDISVPDNLKGNNTKVTVANYDQSIEKKFNL